MSKNNISNAFKSLEQGINKPKPVKKSVKERGSGVGESNKNIPEKVSKPKNEDIVSLEEQEKQDLEESKVHKEVSKSEQFSKEETESDIDNDSHSSYISKELLNEYFGESKKKTMEETHTRRTFLIRNDILKRYEQATKGKRGLKTRLINDALEAMLDALDSSK